MNPDRAGAAPPIVVVSPDATAEAQDRLGGGDTAGGPLTPPRAGTLANRGLRPGPKDTIPISGKPPRKQRSSRFVVNEKVEIERLPAFSGLCLLLITLLRHPYFASIETPASERPQLFIKKLHQCAVVFDFNDANAELKGKQIKTQTLHEMLEYITTQRGVITENIYPEVVKMVRRNRPFDLPVLTPLSSPQTSSALYPLLSTLPEMPSTPKRTSLYLNLLGRISR